MVIAVLFVPLRFEKAFPCVEDIFMYSAACIL